MSISDNQISSNEINNTNVKSVSGDNLVGTVQENKNVFDRLPELIISKFNALIEALSVLKVDTGVINSTSPNSGQVAMWNGTNWTNADPENYGQQQADYAETDSAKVSFVKNKPIMLTDDTIALWSEIMNTLDKGYVNETSDYTMAYGVFTVKSSTISTTRLYGIVDNYINCTLSAGTYTFDFRSDKFTGGYIVYDDNGTNKEWNSGETKTFSTSITIKTVMCDLISLSKGTYQWSGTIITGGGD